MKKLLRYLRVCFIRIGKTYPAILCMMLVLLVCVFLIAGLMLKKNDDSENKQKVEIGVVNNSGEEFVDLGLLALDKIDNLKYTVSFTEMDEKEAKQKLDKGDIVGYVNIPKEYINNIFVGKNHPAVYITKQSSAGFNAVISNKMTKAVSDVVTTSQALIYAVYDIDREIGRKQILEDNEKINAIFMDAVLHRENIYDEQILGIADSVSMPGYYISGTLAFFIFIIGISFCKVLFKSDYSIYRALKSSTIGSVKQIISEFLSFSAFVFISVAIFSFAEFKAFGIYGGVQELTFYNTGMIIGFIIYIIPVIAAISAFQLMLYESVKGIISAVILQFVTVVLFSYLSGFFYPSYYFPEFAKKTGSILPSGVAFSYIRKCLTFTNESADAVPLLVYTILFLSVTIVIREYRIRRDNI